jgi:GAF domain-containing protein
MRTGKPILIENAQSDLRNTGIALKRAKQFDTVPMIVAPLLDQGEVIGTLTAVNTADDPPFTEEDLNLGVMLANQAALALRNAKLLEQVSKARNAARVVAEVTVLEDLQITLDSIVEGTHDVLNCDVVTLYTYDQDRDELGFPPAMVGVNHPEKVLELGKVAEQSIIHNILACDSLYEARNRSSDLLADSPFVEREEIISSMGVPLATGGRKVGVMFVNYRRPHRFTDDELTNIEPFANQAAVAIRNAQLYKQVQSRARLLDAAAQVARGATAILDMDELLNETVRLISDCFGFYHAGVFLLDDDRRYAVLQAAYPKEGPGMLGRGHKLRVGQEGSVGLVTQTGKPHFAPDVEKDPDHLVNPDLPLTRAEMVFPLTARGQVIGALDVQSTEAANVQDEDIAALQTMADQLANAIDNARLYQQVTERLEEANALQQAAVALTGASELEQVLKLIIAEAMKLTDTHESSILLWDAQAEEFTQALRIKPDGTLEPYKSRARTQEGRARQIIDERKPIAISDARQVPGFNPAFLKKGYRATLGVPLLCQGDAIGVLYLRDNEPRQFSDRQVALLETLASQAAVAIDRASQYEELKQTYEELKRTKGLVGARTAVAWMGMVSTAWRHTIEGHAITIQEEIQQLRSDLPQQALDKINRRLAKIERLTKMILDKPITPPLSEEEGVESVSINELLQERIRQLWENEPYKLGDCSGQPRVVKAGL